MNESFDLSGFVALATVNSKGGEIKAAKEAKKRPSYDINYKDADFKVSPETWKKLDLDNHSIQPLVNSATNQVALQIVGDKEGKIFKNNLKEGQKKFHSFRASDIESVLEKAGLITKTVKVKGESNANQSLSLKEVGENLYLIIAISTESTTPAVETTAAPVEGQSVAVEPQAATETVTPEVAPVAVDEVPYTDQVPSADELTVDPTQFEPQTQVAPEQPKQVEDENFDEQF